MNRSIHQRTWTIAEAQTQLSEILRLAAEEGAPTYRHGQAIRRGARRNVVRPRTAPQAVPTAEPQAYGSVAVGKHAARN